MLEVRESMAEVLFCLGWSESWYKSESSQEISKMHTPGLHPAKDFELMGLRRVPGT